MITIKADTRRLVRTLDDVAKRQVPFAVARALTETAQVARNANTRAMPSIFDRPTPFTRNAVTIKAARKSDLTAIVFVKDRQAEYLTLEETGGTRAPEPSKHGGEGQGKALVIPRAIKRNAFGNIPLRGLAQAKRRKDTFVGKTPSGTAGFFRRLADGALQPLALFVKAARYKPRFGFQARTVKVAKATLPVAFRAAFAKALATARR